MKKWFGLGLVAVAVAGSALAEQVATPPTPPSGQAAPRTDSRHHEVRAFEMRFPAPDESARILPPGPWWKDQDLAKRIDLSADQQKRIEDAFLQSKISLIHMHASLEEEELLLEPLLNASPLDQGKVLAQISKIADTRADLEKANAKMLLQIRGVLTQQQWTKLQQERPGGMRQHFIFRTPDGGPRSYNFTMPDMHSVQMRLDAMPALDSEQMSARLQTMLKSMPQLDSLKINAQVQTMLKAMPRVDLHELNDKLQPLVELPPTAPAPLR